jgi:glycosyltransferase involved in cell wall biosynthesis
MSVQSRPAAIIYTHSLLEGSCTFIKSVTAKLVDERDTRALAMAMRSFLESRDKVRDFAEAGREFVAERFDLHHPVSGLEDIYERLRAD